MSRNSLTTLAVIVVATAAANSTFACGGSKYFGGSSYNRVVYRSKPVYHQPVKVVVEKPVIVEKHIADHCHHPKFCLAYVRPGDTLAGICGREYGNPGFWTQVAAFNHMPPGTALAVGQPIKLPTIYDSGRMIPADSPAPPAPAFAVATAPAAIAAPAATGPLAGPQFGPAPQAGLPQGQPGLPQGQPGFPQQQLPQGQPMQQGSFGQPNGQQGQPQQLQMQPNSSRPGMNIRQAERNLPSFAAGSQLVLDGEQFGGKPGQVQLVIGPMTLPIAIANWTPSELTIQLPELPLSKASDARIVILNSEGKLVTQSEIRLTPATSRLAMGG